MNRMSLWAIALIASLGFSLAAQAEPFGYSVRESDQILVQIDLANGTIVEIGPTGGDDIDGLAFAADGTLFGSDNDDEELVTIDLNTGAQLTQTTYSSGISNSGLAFSPNGTLFLADGLGNNLRTVNTTTAQLTLVGPMGVEIDGISFSPNGVLYGIDDDNDTLVTLDTTTGAVATTIGPLGFNTDQQQGLAFDDQGNLYMVDEDSQSLYSVNPNTGTATFIADLGADYENLAIFWGNAYEREGVPVPTLSTIGLALLGLGLSGMAFRRRRISRNA